MSGSFLMGVVLALAGGFLDAYTYVCRGGVFATAETGNMVLLGLRLASGEPKEAIRYIIPIGGFACGVLVSAAVRKKFRESRALHWRQMTVAMEIAVLAAISFVPSSPENNIYTNALVAFAASLQVQSFRVISGVPLTTTMCTGNLRYAAESLFRAASEKNRAALLNAAKYLAIIALFITGAVCGAAVTRAAGIRAALAAAGILLAAFLMMFIDLRKNTKQKPEYGEHEEKAD